VPVTFILAILFAALLVAMVITTVLLRKGAASPNTHPTDAQDMRFIGYWATGIGAFAGVMAAIMLAVSSFNAVGTYDIGVTTSFGKVLSYDGPGPHWIAPWENMSLMDESVQNMNYTLTVRVAGQQTAQADVKLRWQLVPSATDTLFRAYKGNTANVATALVQPELNVAMNSVYDGYDPIKLLATNAAPGTPGNPSTAQLSAEVASALTARIGNDVHIDTLIVEPLTYDQTVRNRINTVLAQTAKTDVAQQSEKTAQAQAKANNIIEQSVANNPLVLVQQCMKAISDGQLNPPAGFSCWPGSSSGIVIPSK